MCGLTRLLMPGFLVGFTVATLTGNDVYGWIGAAATFGALFGVQKVRGTSATCALPPAPVPDRTEAQPDDADTAPTPH